MSKETQPPKPKRERTGSLGGDYSITGFVTDIENLSEPTTASSHRQNSSSFYYPSSKAAEASSSQTDQPPENPNLYYAKKNPSFENLEQNIETEEGRQTPPHHIW